MYIKQIWNSVFSDPINADIEKKAVPAAEFFDKREQR